MAGPLKIHAAVDHVQNSIIRFRAQQIATLAELAAEAPNAASRIVYVLENDQMYWGVPGAWFAIPVSGGGAGNLPPGGSSAQVLLKSSATDFDATWSLIGPTSLATGAVTPAKLATAAVEASKIAAGAVVEAAIGSGAVTEPKIASNAVTGVKINPGAVTAPKLGSAAVTEPKIATSAVTSDKVAAGAITEAKLGTGAVTEDKLGAGSVTDTKIGSGAVVETKIGSGAVTEDKLGAGSVTETKIGTDAVVPSKIQAGAVTASKLASSAVTTAKIADTNVTLAKIQDVSSGVIAGRASGGAGSLEQLSPDQVLTLLGLDTVQVGVYGNSSVATLSGPVTDQSLFPAGVGSLTLPANYLTPGRTLRFHLSGTHSTPGGGPTAEFEISIGGVAASTGSISLEPSATDEPWSLEGHIVCLTDGATGTVAVDFLLAHYALTGGNEFLSPHPAFTPSFVVDTTAPLALDVLLTTNLAGDDFQVLTANVHRSF